MRRASNWSRNLQRGTRLFMAFVLTVLLCLGSVLRAATDTPRGVQCPTAAVQTIRVAKRDCCDRIVGYEVRKPQPGEKAFKQCRCAEKNHGALQLNASPRNEATPPRIFVLEIPPAPVLPWSEPAYAAPVADWSEAPAVRPPAFS